MPEAIENGEPWIQTIGGGAVDLVNPQPDAIDFRHIARVLSRVPRYAGHTESGVFSVAQHCEQGARAILRETGNYEHAKAFLLHDAHEAYIGDMSTPAMDALCVIAEEANTDRGAAIMRAALREQKARLDKAIYTAADMLWPLDEATRKCIREYDVRMCRTERDARMATPPKPWADLIEQAVPVKWADCQEWSAGTIEKLFVHALMDFGILT